MLYGSASKTGFHMSLGLFIYFSRFACQKNILEIVGSACILEEIFGQLACSTCILSSMQTYMRIYLKDQLLACLPQDFLGLFPCELCEMKLVLENRNMHDWAMREFWMHCVCFFKFFSMHVRVLTEKGWIWCSFEQACKTELPACML